MTNADRYGRNELIDILKAIAIILVVFAHCMVNGSGQAVLSGGSYFDDPVFKFITSFNMPLFMLISGFLFAFSVKRHTPFQVFGKKVKTLLVPLLSWAFVVVAILIASKFVNERIILSLREIVSSLVYHFFHGQWFLWAVFWSSVIVLLNRSLFNDSYFVYLAIFVLTFSLPDYHNLALYKFMYPYFVVGYLFNKVEYSKKESFKTKIEGALPIFISWLVFILLLLVYDHDSYIYTSGYRVIRDSGFDAVQLYVDLYRFTIGFAGSVAVILTTIHLFPHFREGLRKTLAYIGANSLGIYILSNVIFNDHLLRTFSIRFTGINYGVALLEAMAVIIVTLLVSYLIKKNQMMNLLFLGGR